MRLKIYLLSNISLLDYTHTIIRIDGKVWFHVISDREIELYDHSDTIKLTQG